MDSWHSIEWKHGRRSKAGASLQLIMDVGGCSGMRSNTRQHRHLQTQIWCLLIHAGAATYQVRYTASQLHTKSLCAVYSRLGEQLIGINKRYLRSSLTQIDP
jgi:hypothetical protein